jgi:hypothetical protein
MTPMIEKNSKRPQWEREIQNDPDGREKYKMTPMEERNTK